MRARAVALVSVLAALVGGAVAIVADRALEDEPVRTVFVPTTVASQPTAQRPDASRASARPLAGNGFDPARIYAERSPGVVTIYAEFGARAQGATSQGSGFVVDRDGVILTNSHVITTAGQVGPVRGAETLYVEFQDGDRVPAEIVGWDLFNDVGVVRVDADDHELHPVPLGDSDDVIVGEPVAAIGSPFGNQNSLAVGVVSATGRSIDSLTSDYSVAGAIQVDAPINHGNSGGPLFDAEGRVIGINAQIRSRSGNAEGVGFAIPINSARRSMEQLLATGRVAYAYIGVRTQDVTPGLARRFGFAAERGALVADVVAGTPAARAGIKGGSRNESYNGLTVELGGDVITAIGDTPVTSAEDVSRIVAEQLLPGQTVPFTILRGGKEKAVVQVRLTERPAEAP